MSSFAINLNKNSEKGERYRRFLLITSLILVGLLVLTYSTFYFIGIYNAWLYIVLGLYVAAFVYFAFSGYRAALYINGNKTILEYKLGFYKKTPTIILWESVKQVKIAPTYLRFYKQLGKRKTLYLGWLPYAKVIDIKSNIENLCKILNIEIVYAEVYRQEE